MTATRYRVAGPRAVAGVAPGGTLELAEDTALNVPALIESGHLAVVKSARRAVNADTAAEDGDG